MRLLKLAVAAIGVIAVLSVLGMLAVCPCGPAPGMFLFGDEVSEPVTDWQRANEVGLCQVQVSTWYSRSINLNCMSANGELFVSCSNCQGKQWSTQALANPSGYIRMASAVYPVTFERLTSPAELDIAWQARSDKLKRATDSKRPEHWWSFRLTSRG